jgi:hypothetical protein
LIKERETMPSKPIPAHAGLRAILRTCGPQKKTPLKVRQDLAWLEEKSRTDPLAAYVRAVADRLNVDLSMEGSC